MFSERTNKNTKTRCCLAFENRLLNLKDINVISLNLLLIHWGDIEIFFLTNNKNNL